MKKIILLSPVILIVLLLMTAPVLARAGGGGASDAVNPIIAFILAPFVLIYGAILAYSVNKKKQRCEKMLSELEEKDPVWALDCIRERVEETFFAVQEAWEERDQDKAAQYMSKRLYKKHKSQTDGLKKKGLINMLDNKNLITMDIVQISDYLDDSKDALWVFIEGSMYDYYVDEATKKTVRGNAGKKEHFRELWKFIRQKDTWVLDEIDQEATVAKISAFKPFSEDLDRGKKRGITAGLLLVACVAAALFLLGGQELYARAGGGGRSGGGIITLILMPFILIYSAIIAKYVKTKSMECEELMKRICTMDPVWKKEAVIGRIKEAFFAIQKAWMLRDQDTAKEYMSDRLYKKHKTQTDEMIRKHRQNIMKNISISEVKVVEIADYKNDKKDKMWAYISATMADYNVNDITGEVLETDKDAKKPYSFSELWKFIRMGNSWVADEIKQQVTINDLRRFAPFTEMIGKKK